VTPQLTAVLSYARQRLATFPLRPGAKTPLTDHGHLDATTDPGVLTDWWGRWPDANVGIACRPSGLVVVDVDPRNGGDDSLADLERQYGSLPATWRALTGGGVHAIFQAPGDVPLVDGALAPGIDLKANGYIVAPPSLHPNGRRYAWECGHEPGSLPLAALPGWLLERVCERASDRLRADGTPLMLRAGERNVGLFRLACLLRRRGVNARALHDCLEAINSEHAHPPLGAAELERIAVSAARYAPALRTGATA
jgi:putative DNA primase/helicase